MSRVDRHYSRQRRQYSEIGIPGMAPWMVEDCPAAQANHMSLVEKLTPCEFVSLPERLVVFVHNQLFDEYVLVGL